MQSLNGADLGVDTSNSFQILVIVHLLKLSILVFSLWFCYSLLKAKKIELIQDEGSWLILKKKKKNKKIPHWNTLFYSLIPQRARAHTQKKEKDKKIENPESKREIN